MSEATKAREEALQEGAIIGDNSDEETELEQLGDINILQRYRIKRYYSRLRDPTGPERDSKREIPMVADPLISHHLFRAEEDLRELVQKEATFRLDTSGESIQEVRNILEALNKKYWKLEQIWWQCYSSLMDGHQRRAFDLWRSNPKWYMHATLVEDCANKKGCCSRGCGCCSRREASASRPLGVGHCTVECSCCQKFRGFEVSEDTKIALRNNFDSLLYDAYGHRLVRVAMWGLVGGIDESPFDMIRVGDPPSYSQVQASDRRLGMSCR